uniref:RUN domain-containing protein n=1 Tax=Macrostomum lignano TaxID=282301 RepID=A0A1I8G8Y1_9PLAT
REGMAKLLQRVVSDAATKVAGRRGGNSTLPEMQRADTEPSQQAAVAAALEKINSSGAEYREMLLRHVKREVKQLMEESVTRRGVHQECSIITSLCAGVDNCLLYGLKRHSLGMFRDSSTLALLQKISRSCPAAKAVTDRLQTDESASQPASSSSSNSSSIKRPVQSVKFQWIRVALMEKHLARIIEHLVENGRQFYETDSIIGDPCDGPLLASLLVGPCALEFDKSQGPGMEMCTDLSADELLQRHRIHSPLRNPAASPKPARKPSLKLKRSQSPAGGEAAANRRRSPAGGGMAEFVQLLHQNSRATLLFGKNNVLSQTPALPRKMPGYLSLHLEPSGLTVKWMPNLLMMAGSTSDSEASLAAPNSSLAASASGSESGQSNPASPWQAGETIEAPPWESALTIRVEDMVYIHCHSNQPVGCSLVFVAHDGTQKPPLQFPPGGHLLQFLTCLENGLLPGGALEPPLWSHRCKGKLLPRMKRRSILKDSFISGLIMSGDDADKGGSQANAEQSDGQPADEQPGDSEQAPSDFDDNMDFVFRIVMRESKYRSATAEADPVEEAGSVFSWQESYSAEALQSRLTQPAAPAERQQTIRQACDSMRKQILSRAFYGWLAHVRHMSCVRRHLPDLVTCRAGLGRREDYPDGLTEAIWEAGDKQEAWRALYWGGCSKPELRKKSSEAERQRATEAAQARFENLLSEWGPLDAIVRENDRELAATARDLMIARARTSAATPTPAGRPLLAVPGRLAEASPATEDAAAATPSKEGAAGGSAAVPSSLSRESIASSASQASNGGVYSSELIDSVTANWHRIDKDVDRCDRHVTFFTVPANLEKLRNIMCCYVWQNLSEEGLTLACFSLLMKQMVANFPGAAENCASTESLMDQHLANLRATIQVTDPQLFEHMLKRGDYTHFYFCYRWFLLEFKREFCYKDVCLIWDTIWSASHLVSKHFNVFVAMALLKEYRGVIIENDMDFTDIIKFYNEMAEHHRLSSILESRTTWRTSW